MMSYGLKVPLNLFDDLCSFCENKEIDYLVWNADDMLHETAECAELEFDTERERDEATEFLKRMKGLEEWEEN